MIVLNSPALLLAFGTLTGAAFAQTCDVRLQGTDLNGGELMGSAVQVSGNLVFSGAPGERVAGTSVTTGAVYVHSQDAMTLTWSQVDKLEPAGLSGPDLFGSSMDQSGNTLAIGAPNRNNVLATKAGSVYVMTHDGSGTNWTVDGLLTASDGVIEDSFGTSVAIDGDHMLVGSPYHDATGTNKGAAYAFKKVGGVWTETQKILPPVGVNGSQFGARVALVNDVAVIGGPSLTVPGGNGGGLVSFVRDGMGQYNDVQVIQPIGLDIADFFASSVDMVGDLLVTGTTNDDDGASNAGAVHVFRYDAMTQMFTEEAKLTRSNPASGDVLGKSVATDGVSIVAGGSGIDPAGGSVVFRNFGSGWVEFRKVQPQELGTGGDAGSAVAIQGDMVAMGDTSDDSLFFRGGATFITDVSVADQNNNGLGDLCEDVGVHYCDPAVANSTGLPGEMSAIGSPFVSDNQITLQASQLPAFQFGIFITSQTQGLILNPGGSLGNLCFGGPLGRYNQGGQIFGTSAGGTGELAIDLTQTPQPSGFVSVLAGESWNYQAWYRDSVGGQSESNFTNGIEITFQ
ncbi:MAG: hypothetical protein P1V35_08560 [Planctomycetota bacterium]|nr:hypothetical protein [Planctomycetota bacterium]